MILLHNIIQILNLPKFSLHWDQSLILNSFECRRICSVFINADNSRNTAVTISKSLSKNFLSCRLVSSFTEYLIKSVPFRINCSIEVMPFPFDLDVGLIYSVRIVGWFQKFFESFLKLQSILMNPSHDRCVTC